MAFVNPLLLYGLFALAIPVLIHLFNFRRYRKIYFTNVRFLTAIKQETRKRSELRQLLILASRLLAVASLVLAFAQPFIPSPSQHKKNTGYQTVSIYIDNSFSMEASTANGSLLQAAKKAAADVAAAGSPSDQFLLVTNEEENGSYYPVSREEFLGLVRDVKLSPVSAPVSSVVLRQKEGLRNARAENPVIYLISDFQRSTSNLSSLPPDTLTSYFLLPLNPGKRNNLYIDTAWFESPVQQPGLSTRLQLFIRNAGEEPVDNIPVKLTINGKVKAVSGISIGAGARTGISLPYTHEPGWLEQGKVEILDYPVVFDNTLFFSCQLTRSLPVLIINEREQNPYLSAVFSDDSTFILSQVPVKQIDYSSFQKYPVILLNGLQEISTGLAHELNRFVKAGGHLVLFPSKTMNLESYRNFSDGCGLPRYADPDTASIRVDKVNTESLLFSDVFEKNATGKVTMPENTDLPVCFFHFRLSGKSLNPPDGILGLENGDAFLAAYSEGKGRIYLFASPLDPAATNFPRHPLFVPVLFNIGLLSKSRQHLFYSTGSNEPIEIVGDTLNSKTLYKITDADGTFEVIPEMRNTGSSVLLYPRGQIREAGHYLAERNRQPVMGVSVNYARAESEPGILPIDEIKSVLEKSGIRYAALLKDNKVPVIKQIRDLQQGKPLWKLFLLLSLLFIATEIAIIRIMK